MWSEVAICGEAIQYLGREHHYNHNNPSKEKKTSNNKIESIESIDSWIYEMEKSDLEFPTDTDILQLAESITISASEAQNHQLKHPLNPSSYHSRAASNTS